MRPHVAVIGAGPAGLMAAEVIAAGGTAHVTVFDRMPSPARKLLLAGRGGLNLTHSEDVPTFLGRYGSAADTLRSSIEGFSPSALRLWCAELGNETFVGSSGRVFPMSFKTSPLLRAWLRRLDASGIRLVQRHLWQGWDGDGRLGFQTQDGVAAIEADAVVLALGGASWPQLGSDGSWVGILRGTGIDVAALQPANCGFVVHWSDTFRERFHGEPLKSVALTFADHRGRGDVVVTRAGLEGGAVYQLAAPLRTAILRDGEARLQIALRPDLTHEALVLRLGKRQPKQSFSTALRKTLNLSPVAIALLREARTSDATSPTVLDTDTLARLVNAVSLRLTAATPVARAISTAGGVPFGELDARLMVKRHPGTFIAGEMLDWEAPTGGYLLQACFATGVTAGRGVLAWLADRELSRAGTAVADAKR